MLCGLRFAPGPVRLDCWSSLHAFPLSQYADLLRKEEAASEVDGSLPWPDCYGLTGLVPPQVLIRSPGCRGIARRARDTPMPPVQVYPSSRNTPPPRACVGHAAGPGRGPVPSLLPRDASAHIRVLPTPAPACYVQEKTSGRPRQPAPEG